MLGYFKYMKKSILTQIYFYYEMLISYPSDDLLEKYHFRCVRERRNKRPYRGNKGRLSELLYVVPSMRVYINICTYLYFKKCHCCIL